MQSAGIRRRALCIGIEYKDHKDVEEITGAHTDAKLLATFLRDNFGYEVDVMVDDGVGSCQPTKKNIYAAVQRLIEGARAEDRFFFHFSGHGTQMKNLNDTERDGLDEIILPVDCKINHDYPDEHHPNHWFEDSRIMDDELNAWFLPTLPSGSRLTVSALIDACHSGTALDLKYTYNLVPRCQIPPELGSLCESPTTYISPGDLLSPVAETAISRLTRDCPQPSIIPGYSAQVRKCSGVLRRCRSLTIHRTTDYPQQAHQEGPVVVFWAPCPDANNAYGSSKGGLMVNLFVDYLGHLRENLPTNRDLLYFLHHGLRKKFNELNNKPVSQIELQEPQLGTNMPPVLDQLVVL